MEVRGGHFGINACWRLGSLFIFACPESGEKFAVGKDLNAVHLPASRLQTDAQITLELFLLAQGAQGEFREFRGHP